MQEKLEKISIRSFARPQNLKQSSTCFDKTAVSMYSVESKQVEAFFSEKLDFNWLLDTVSKIHKSLKITLVTNEI